MILSSGQPLRYGSKRMAKTHALVTVLSIRGRVHIGCFGNRRHYEPTSGICCHVEDVAHHLSPWHKSRAVLHSVRRIQPRKNGRR